METLQEKRNFVEFENKGYFKDYYLNGKYIGSTPCERDRETFGYLGRKTEVVEQDLILSKSKMIKGGSTVVTELQMICGRLK